MKKSLCILAVLLVMAFCLSVQAEGVEWRAVDGNTLYDFYGAGGGDVVVPAMVGDTPILQIRGGLSATKGSTNITSVRFSEGIAIIGNFVCEELDTLTSITLPDSLLVIDSSCIRGNPNLTEITIPPAVCLIGYDALNENTSLRTVRFTGPCPVIVRQIFRKLPEDAVIYVPDDELDAYTAALQNAGVKAAIQPSGQNAIRPALGDDTANIVFDASTGTITGYNGKAVRLDIPAEINGVPVKIIGAGAFKGREPLMYVTIPDGVETIEADAFRNNVPLTYVRFPSTLKTIGDYAFGTTGLAVNMTLPEGLTAIGSGAFNTSNLDGCNVYLPSSLEAIGDQAFEFANVKYIASDSSTPPALGANVFANCRYLTDIDIHYQCSKQQMLEWQAYVDALGLSCRVWRHQNPNGNYPVSGDTYAEAPDGSMLFAGYTGDIPNIRSYGSYYVGDELKWITGVADGALKGNTVVTFFAVSYTDEYKTIGAEAFAGSVLQHVDLFDSVTTIGAGAFRDCARLEDLTLPESVTAIGADAFAGCTGLKKVDIRCDASLLPDHVFAGNTVLTQANVSAGAIPAGAFRDTALVSLRADAGVTAIGAGALQNCAQLEELTIPETVTAIGADAFAGCTGLKKVAILCDASLLPENAFAGCASLTEATVAHGAIPAGCFQNTGLTVLNLGESVTAIGENAFANTRLASFVIPVHAEVAASAISGIPELRLSDDATEEQVAAWSEKLNLPWYAPILRASETRQPLAAMPFAPTDESLFNFDPETGSIRGYNGTAVDVVIPRTIGGVPVTTLRGGLFTDAKDYTDTEVLNNQKDWLHLRSVVIPETVTKVDDSLLEYCQQLETVICYAPLETTGRAAFHFCRNLKNVVFVNGVRNIDHYAFERTDALENLYVGSHVDTVYNRTFTKTGLKSLVLDAVTVQEGAVFECANLTEMHFSARCKTVAAAAVGGAPALQLVCFEGTDLSFIPGDGIVYSGPKTVTVRTREGVSEEHLKLAKGSVNLTADMKMPKVTLETGNCDAIPVPMPDVAALMAPYGITPVN